MNKKVNKSNKAYKVIIFWSVISIMTIIFVIATINIYARYQTIDSLEDVSKLRLAAEAVYHQDEATYFVYVYPKDGSVNYTQKTKDVEPIVLEYLNYVKHKYPDDKKNIFKMYLFCVDDAANRGCLVDEIPSGSDILASNDYFSDFKIKRSDLPQLLKVNAHYIVDRQILKTEIANELQNEMTKVVEEVNSVMYLPEDKEERI